MPGPMDLGRDASYECGRRPAIPGDQSAGGLAVVSESRPRRWEHAARGVAPARGVVERASQQIQPTALTRPQTSWWRSDRHGAFHNGQDDRSGGPAPWTGGAVGAALYGVAIHDSGQPRFDPDEFVVARLSMRRATAFHTSLLSTGQSYASLAGAPGIVVVTSATIMPSRLTPGLQEDSLDDPERLRALAQETAAGTVVSGSYFRSGDRISFQAEITDANDGTLLDAVGPVTAPVDRPGEAIDSLARGVEAGLHRQRHSDAASGS